MGKVFLVSLLVASLAFTGFVYANQKMDVNMCTTWIIYSAGEERTRGPVTRLLKVMLLELTSSISRMERKERMRICAQKAEESMRKSFGAETIRLMKQKWQ